MAAASVTRSPAHASGLRRDSSATSGFRFCGIMLSRVAYALVDADEPELLRGPQHDLLGQSRDVERSQGTPTGTRRQKSRADTASIELSKTRRTGGRQPLRTVEPEGRAGQRAPSADTSARAPAPSRRSTSRQRERCAPADGGRASLAARAAGACIRGSASRRAPLPARRALRSACAPARPDPTRRPWSTDAGRWRPGRCGCGPRGPARPGRPAARSGPVRTRRARP